MSDRLFQKLDHYSQLSEEHRQALNQLESGTIVEVEARRDIFSHGDRPERINLVLQGWACRYVTLEDGRRQITALLLPGDSCDLRMYLLRNFDHSVGTLTTVRVAQVRPEDLQETLTKHPALQKAFWMSGLVEEATARAWVANIGQRAAGERMGHLFCEVFLRLQAVGLTEENSCEFPMTQDQMADALGISSVHVNRTLMDLRTAGLISLRDKKLTIPNLEALMAASLFEPDYLHIER